LTSLPLLSLSHTHTHATYDEHTQQGARGDAFLNRVQNIAARVPYATCPGNHEIEDGSFTHYRYRFHSIGSDDDTYDDTVTK
jgi:hypothetical protein